MTQPSFVPIRDTDEVRPAHRLQVPRQWAPRRPAELRGPARPMGRRFGKPGPDQGYALRVARTFEARLVLCEDEDIEDVLLGCALLAGRRAGAMGRAPGAPDVRWALELWGFLDPDPPSGLVAARVAAFASLSHDYVAQRQLVDQVPEGTLTLATEEVGARRADWRDLTGAGGQVAT